MKHIKHVLVTLLMSLIVTGLLGIKAPAAIADDTNTKTDSVSQTENAPAKSQADSDTNDFEFTVTGRSTDKATATTTIKNSRQALINGAVQALWEDAYFNVKLTNKSVKEAWSKRIKVVATGSNSSQVIYQKSRHRQLVVLTPGSKVLNTGKHNQRRVGTKWTITRPAIVKYDKKSKQYRHAADLLTKSQLTALQKTVKDKRMYRVVGKLTLGGRVYYIVIWCGNYIGGKVTIYKKLVMVRFKEDLLMEGDAESVAKTGVTFDFRVSCPSTGATFNVQGFAWAYGAASSHVRYTQHTRAAVLGSLEYQAIQNISINQTTLADAKASVTITGTCGKSEQTYDKPLVAVDALACVYPGDTRTARVTVTNPNDIADSVSGSFNGQSLETRAIGANGGQVVYSFPNLGAGSYNGVVTLVTAGKSASFTVTVEKCDTPKPQLVPPTVNDVVVDNVRTITFTGKLAKGTTGFATASAGTGTIQGARRVALNVDSEGYFTVTWTYKAGNEPGRDTVTVVVDQSDGQSVTEKTKGRDSNGNVVDYFNILPAPVDPM